jgi:hypothetical protein
VTAINDETHVDGAGDMTVSDPVGFDATTHCRRCALTSAPARPA